MIRPARPGRFGGEGNPLFGILLLGRGRAAGMAQFGATPNAYLASLAPLVAFPLVGALLLILRGDPIEALTDFLEVICALLAPAVLSQALARFWRCEAAWLRYATAFNWCQWLMPLVLTLALIVFGIALQLGLPERAAGIGVVGVLALYALWLHWFVARHGLGLSGWRSAGLVVVVNVGTLVMLLVPGFLAAAVERAT